MNMNEIVIDPLTRRLLMENGKIDREKGIQPYDGWDSLAKELGFSANRTPASEAYLDGYYGVPIPSGE